MKISFTQFKKWLVESVLLSEKKLTPQQASENNALTAKAYKITELFPCVYVNLKCKPFTIQNLVLDKETNRFKLSKETYELVNSISENSNPLKYTNNSNTSLGDKMNFLLNCFTGNKRKGRILEKKLLEAEKVYEKLIADDCTLCYWTPKEEQRTIIDGMPGNYEEETDIVALCNLSEGAYDYLQISLKADAIEAKNTAKSHASWKLKNRTISSWFETVKDEEFQAWLKEKWYIAIIAAANNELRKLNANWSVIKHHTKPSETELTIPYEYIKDIIFSVFADPSVTNKYERIQSAVYSIMNKVQFRICEAFATRMKTVKTHSLAYFKLILLNSLGFRISTEGDRNPLLVWESTANGCIDHTAWLDKLANSISDSRGFNVENKTWGAIITWNDKNDRTPMSLGLEIRMADKFKDTASLVSMIDKDLNFSASKLTAMQMNQLSQVKDIFWTPGFAALVKSPLAWKVQVQGNSSKNRKIKKSELTTENIRPIITFGELRRLINENLWDLVNGSTLEDDESKFEIEDGVLKEYNGKDENVVIPDGVTVIGKDAFKKRKCIKSVTMPSSVTEISYSAFEGCSNLESVALSDSLEKIYVNAFAYCESLASITIPKSVTKIGAYAFDMCESLKSINMLGNVEYIDDWAFSRCTSLESVEIPSGIKFIGKGLFSYCHNLKTVTVPNTVTYIDDSAFSACYNLKSITLPSSVYRVEGRAFFGCDKVEIKILNSRLYEEMIKNPSKYGLRKRQIRMI